MITNNNDITKYENWNLQYLPNELINSNYIYQYNGDYIHIIKNTGCYTNQYNQQYCDCNNYNWKTNVTEITYSCRRDNQYSSIAYQSLTNDINYSERINTQFTRDKITMIGIIIIAIIFTILLTKEIRY